MLWSVNVLLFANRQKGVNKASISQHICSAINPHTCNFFIYFDEQILNNRKNSIFFSQKNISLWNLKVWWDFTHTLVYEPLPSVPFAIWWHHFSYGLPEDLTHPPSLSAPFQAPNLPFLSSSATPIINYSIPPSILPPLSSADYLTPQAWQLCSPVGITSLREQPCYWSPHNQHTRAHWHTRHT